MTIRYHPAMVPRVCNGHSWLGGPCESCVEIDKKGEREMRSYPAAIGLFILVLAGPAWATLIDEIGSTQLSGNTTPSSPFHGKGNLFRVDQSVTLTEQAFYLHFTDSKTMTFCVYESVSGSQMGDCIQIQSKQVAMTGSGSTWYSSGPVNVPLQAGHYYIIAYSLPGSFTSYWTGGLDSVTVSFGEQLSGISNIVDPAPTSLSISSDNKAIYYQRLTTEVPEPTAAGLLGLGVAAVFARRRNRPT